MKIKIKLSIIFLSILCLISISNADTGFGISDVGTISSITGIEDENIRTINFGLEQNYPNPFNPNTTISFSLAKSSFVTLEIFNSLGEKMATLVNKQKSMGFHEVKFDASKLASGIYLYRIQAGKYSQFKKMLVVK